MEATAYTAEALQSIADKINGKSAVQIASEAALERTKRSRFYAGIALNRSIMQFDGKNALTDPDHNPAAYGPRLVFGVDAFVNKNTQRLLLRVEGALVAEKHLIEKNHYNSGGYYDLSYRVAQQTASVTPQFIYNFYNKENFKLYAGGGLTVNYSNYSTNRYNSGYVSTGTGPSYDFEETEGYELEHVWTAFSARAGVVLYNKHELAAVYQAPGELTEYADFGIEQHAFSLGINYLFTK